MTAPTILAGKIVIATTRNGRRADDPAGGGP
jgi:hypothetical protein